MNDLTFEEVKEAAAKLGYRLVKKRESIVMKLCPVCGKKRRSQWYLPDGTTYFKCSCGFLGEKGKTDSMAKRNWNRAVDRYLEEHKDDMS